jgi:hypothetical protein
VPAVLLLAKERFALTLPFSNPLLGKIEVKGICAALTDIPRDSNSEMTFVQLEPSAQAPCTSTTVTLQREKVTAHRLARAQGPRRAAKRVASRFQERQQVCVDGLGLRGGHTVWKALIGLQRPLLQ